MNDSKNYQYNDVASEFDKTLLLPFRQYIELPLTYSLIGNVKGLNALDLACGTGQYTRYLHNKGASVQGTDISEEMLRIAREIETKHPLGIKYFLQDVLDLEKTESFDLITAIYLLHYFQTKEQLIKGCQNIFNNLKRGGRFLTYVLNPDFKNQQGYYKKYGFDIYESEKLQDGCIARFYFNNSDKILESYYWTKQSLEEALYKAGFGQIKWIKPIVSDNGIQKLGAAFWENYLKHPRLIHIEALKN